MTETKFTIENIPFGIFSYKNSKKRLCTILNNQVVDLSVLAEFGYFEDLKIKKSVFGKEFLNDFIGLGKGKTNAVRKRLQEILSEKKTFKKSNIFHNENEINLHLPIRIGDYTDFYSSEQHATNVGKMFRPDKPLLPNWKNLPVAYHGRASSIFVSGTDFHRPKGQVSNDETKPPFFTPTKRLDFELEMATVIGKSNSIGENIDVNEANDYIFGFLLFNDWSARDIQRWEYQPLGPFLSKNFFSSVSSWVVTSEALEPFKTEAPNQIPDVLPYLKENIRFNFDINLEAYLIPKSDSKPNSSLITLHSSLISKTNSKNLYWTVAQQIAHHTINGCNLNIGDLLASGTISGNEPDSCGSLLELTEGGKKPLIIADGIERAFLQDGDTIIIRGFAEKNELRIDFGEVRNSVLPTK